MNKYSNYTASYISDRMSLRSPQAKSLEILNGIFNTVHPQKNTDIKQALEQINCLYPTCTSFEREFPSITFALATGVGKTRLMGAFITYLYTQHGINNFFVVAPGTTIYEKLRDDLSRVGTKKYVFRGLDCFALNPPHVITDTDYRQKSLAFTQSDVNIYVYNIGKFNRESTKMREFNEVLGEAFFDKLAAMDDLVLIMDESHHYRAKATAKALNDLNPILGLELTATPLVQKGKQQVPFKNVVYEYPLSRAIEDGYTRTPFALTRTDVLSFNFGDAEIDRMMLNDGINHHEKMREKLREYAQDNQVSPVKPFMLVVCKDTEHANRVEKYIKSKDFKDGAYALKTITLHSKKSGAITDVNMQLLLSVELPDSPVEVVIHVDKLKEGWDVNNLYTIVPLRCATSKILREQMVGRGLRLPYGVRVGDEMVDSVVLTAHDKFDDILSEAKRGDSIFRAGNVIVVDGDEEVVHPVQPKMNLFSGGGDEDEGGGAGGAGDFVNGALNGGAVGADDGAGDDASFGGGAAGDGALSGGSSGAGDAVSGKFNNPTSGILTAEKIAQQINMAHIPFEISAELATGDAPGAQSGDLPSDPPSAGFATDETSSATNTNPAHANESASIPNLTPNPAQNINANTLRGFAHETHEAIQACVEEEIQSSTNAACALTPAITKKIVEAASEKVQQNKDYAQIYAQNKDCLFGLFEKTVETYHVCAMNKFIPIPRLKVTESGVQEFEFEDFDLDVSNLKFKPIKNDLMYQNLIDSSDVSFEGDDLIVFDVENPRRVLLDVLREKPEIDYNTCGALLNKLVEMVCEYFEIKHGQRGLQNIVMMNKHAIADEIYNQMMQHFRCKEGLFTYEVIGIEHKNLQPVYSADEQVNIFSDDYTHKINQVLFTGLKKGVFDCAKFDSAQGELTFARLLERDPGVINWLRPAKAQFSITYSNGKHYVPDFVVETDEAIYLVEVKGENMLNNPDVLAKAECARKYCDVASRWGSANGYKAWKYLFVPATQAHANASFAGLVSRWG